MAVVEYTSPEISVSDLVALLDDIGSVEESSRNWPAQRAALALVGAGAREAEGALRRYATMRSIDGSWRATRWSELPGLLSLPIPERLSAIWARFPFEAHALSLVRPEPNELASVLAILVGRLENEDRRWVPTGAACLLAAAALAAELRVPLPRLKTRWWLELHRWGQADEPGQSFEGEPISSIAPANVSPALVRDTTITTAFSRSALRSDLVALRDPAYRSIGEGWLLLADLDGFKRVNDIHGLPSGDSVLAQIVDRWQRRFGDCVIRYAGEQFVIPWRGAGALAVAEEMRSIVESEPFALPESEESLPVTVSVGVAQFSEVGQGIRDALAAVAEAKRAGRNCVWS